MRAPEDPRISALQGGEYVNDAALKKLATTGEFEPELAEAFGIACNYETAAVIEAFRERRPVA